MNETTKRTELLILNVLTTQARTELKLDHEMDTPGDVASTYTVCDWGLEKRNVIILGFPILLVL
jgi:hypothetical protein